MMKMMKTNADSVNFAARLRKLFPFSSRTGPLLAACGAFLFSLAVVIANMNAGMGGGSPDEFEVGKVAERDVIAEQAVTYEDTEATRQRQEARERMVPAVFHFDFSASGETKAGWNRFAALVESLGGVTDEVFVSTVEAGFPGLFSADVLELVYQNPDRAALVREAGLILNNIVDIGVFAMPEGSELENLNPEVVELIRNNGARVEREQILFSAIVTGEDLPEAVESRLALSPLGSEYFLSVFYLIEPFLKANVVFSAEETALRLAETRSKTEPVIKYIERGKRVIKKGFIVTEEEMTELGVLTMSTGSDIRIVFSRVLLLSLAFGFLVFAAGKRVIGRGLSDSEVYLVCVLSAFYIAGSVLARNVFLGFTWFPVSIIIPTALVIMLPAILIHPRLALLLAVILPVGAFISDSFDTYSFIFALVSGTAASFVLQDAEKRMDLVKAGLVIAAANCAAVIALSLSQRVPAGVYPGLLFWAAFNGIASGMLVLGFLPPLENLLGAATAFRLIELSDLNAPVLRRLFTAAPGTYSHSIMVANLAEAACQDIDANPLLARVGAYYHDIGKMDNPYYFVENQADYNPHDDLPPRHSATILRNHVKLGVEKARQLRLPREVIEIIADHHGDSVITWFYSKAVKLEAKENKKAAVNIDDFKYQGSPPRSRESAIVSLADMSEAAVRTLEKPTQAKMETYIQELFSAKMEHGQFARSELTFKDIELIRQAFVRVLMGYHHNRIAYPKVEIPKEQDPPLKEAEGEPEAESAGDSAAKADS